MNLGRPFRRLYFLYCTYPHSRYIQRASEVTPQELLSLQIVGSFDVLSYFPIFDLRNSRSTHDNSVLRASHLLAFAFRLHECSTRARTPSRQILGESLRVRSEA